MWHTPCLWHGEVVPSPLIVRDRDRSREVAVVPPGSGAAAVAPKQDRDVNVWAAGWDAFGVQLE